MPAGAVRLLNGTTAPVPNASREPAGPPAAAATDRDIGDALATCRSGYQQLSDQLNAILDIEELRH